MLTMNDVIEAATAQPMLFLLLVWLGVMVVMACNIALVDRE